jgi:predicted RNase H-like nuclease
MHADKQGLAVLCMKDEGVLWDKIPDWHVVLDSPLVRHSIAADRLTQASLQTARSLVQTSFGVLVIIDAPVLLPTLHATVRPIDRLAVAAADVRAAECGGSPAGPQQPELLSQDIFFDGLARVVADHTAW